MAETQQKITFGGFWMAFIEAVFKNRLISRKSLIAISFGMMIFWVGLPLDTVTDLFIDGEKPAELAVLPEPYQYWAMIGFMSLKVIALGLLAWYAVKSQKDLDLIEKNNGNNETP